VGVALDGSPEGSSEAVPGALGAAEGAADPDDAVEVPGDPLVVELPQAPRISAGTSSRLGRYRWGSGKIRPRVLDGRRITLGIVACGPLPTSGPGEVGNAQDARRLEEGNAFHRHVCRTRDGDPQRASVRHHDRR
jgi:hypothetical protein